MATSHGSGSGRIAGFIKGLAIGLLVLVAGLVALALILPAPEEEATLAGAGESLGDEAGGESLSDDSLVARTEPEGEAAVAPEPDGGSVEPAEQAGPSPGNDGAAAEPVGGNSTESMADAGESGAAPADGSQPQDTSTSAGSDAGELEEAGASQADDTVPEEDTQATAEATVTEAAEPPMPPPLEGGAPPSLSGPALEINATTFTGGEQPLVAVVIDNAAAGEVTDDVILSLPLDVALAIAPLAEGAERLAEAARRRTFEVVAELPVVDPGSDTPGALAAGMAPEDVGARTEALLGLLDEAVAASLDGDRLNDEARAAMAEALDRHGFGFVGEGGGPVPSIAPTHRAEPSAGAEEVRALLDEAAAAAGEGGGAVVVLPPTRAALQALADWNASEGQGRIAPLSAVLRQGTEGAAQ